MDDFIRVVIVATFTPTFVFLALRSRGTRFPILAVIIPFAPLLVYRLTLESHSATTVTILMALVLAQIFVMLLTLAKQQAQPDSIHSRPEGN